MASYCPSHQRKNQGGGNPKLVGSTLSRYPGVPRTACKRHKSIDGCIRAEITVPESRTNRSEADDSGGGANPKRFGHFPAERETHTARPLAIAGVEICVLVTDLGPYRAYRFYSCIL